MLLLRAGSTVPVDQLVDALWPKAPPHSARNQVQACVSRLRKQLATAGIPGDVIATDPSGYRLQVERECIDIHEFRAQVEKARKEVAQGERREARDRYRTAIGLWRGPALADVDGSRALEAAAALAEERTQAVVERIEVELALGHAGELIGEITELVQQHPYRESLQASLMRALYQMGRPADALAAFRHFRKLLRDELGTEPGEELQRLHQAILNRDPALSVVGAGASPAPPIPRELPAEASCFVGREQEAAQLTDALTPSDLDTRRRPPIVLLYGPGGVGKSALAVRVAHEVADAYPDGQLYVDLCGSTPGRQPIPPAEVLGRFLRRLGVAPDQIPPDETDASALLRSVCAGRRLLLVLDNAADKDQVAPVLPGSPGCGAIVTCRHRLSSLDADRRVRVAVLADKGGLALLSGLTDGLAADSEAAEAIVTLSAGLPLAIRIAAGRLASRPDLSITEFAQRLADRSRRLDELKLDDLAVRACIRTSYDALQSSDGPTERLAARTFRMLGLLHVPDFTLGVITAMLSEPAEVRVMEAMDRLVDAQLLEPIRSGRYRPHDLVRLVAVEIATSCESQSGVDGVHPTWHSAS
jgi:DNA-binding SARP family transcriptional activator